MPSSLSGSSSRLRPEDVPRRSFTRNRRGFDPAEVAAFLEELSDELAAWEEREEELLRQVGEAEPRRQAEVEVWGWRALASPQKGRQPVSFCARRVSLQPPIEHSRVSLPARRAWVAVELVMQ